MKWKVIRLEDAKASDWPKVIKELTPDELKEVYAALRASFTADDLQKFTEVDDIDDVDMGEFLAELEKLQEEHDRKPAA